MILLPTSTRTLLLLLLTLVTFQSLTFITLTTFAKDLPYSLYYDLSEDSWSSIRALDAARLTFTNKYISHLSSSPSALNSTKKTCPKIKNNYCIGIVATTSRLQHHYLKKTIASLSSLGGVDCVSNFFISLRKTIPSNGDVEILKNTGFKIHEFEDKGNKGGVNAADIIVVIEEDVWSTPEFLLKLDNAIQNLKGEEWSCLKLFVTDYWSGWENDYKDFITLGFWGVLGAGGGEGFIVGLMWVKGKKWGGLCDWRKILLRIYLITLTITSLIILGKQGTHLTSISQAGVYPHPMGASSLGIAYPRGMVNDLIPFLRSGLNRKMSDKTGKGVKNIPIDLLLQEFHNTPSASKNRKQYIIVPSLLQHTGEFSSSSYKARGRGGMSEREYYQEYMKLAGGFEDLGVEELERLGEEFENAN
ncbi:hypothetical protein TL16_g04986 [Triparma laevis f. inornata]|uniref:Uncharacterized protein n=2 Tax=Triparma laevis TaxID=1534972 RepID=A0A9W7KVN0_9STRA|nr:hypothetical protein TL16_g04986 [Triparma laevis f. inornata]GMI12951.1 hypothetical protein TrLO_g7206 [Triparma laevis f. longispina]